jgi:S1-C subfamily serine protease
MIISLLAFAVLSDVAITVRSEGLGVTAYTARPGVTRPGESPRRDDRPLPPMLRVGEVEPGKPGACTGLKPGDMIVGVTSYEVFKPEDIIYPPITPAAFERFPPTVGTMNTVASILVYRPSLDSTAQLRVLFSGEPDPWPPGALGIVVKDAPVEGGIPEGGPGKAGRVEVVRVHPYSLADRSGILPRDVIAGAVIEGKATDDGIEFMPFPKMIGCVADLTKVLDVVRKTPDATVVAFTVRRGHRWVTVDVPAGKLR